MQLPKLKKKVHAFLTSEEGKISKETIIKAGAIAVLATQAVSAQTTTITDHTNAASIKTDDLGRTFGEHTHSPYHVHTNHSSHSSHGYSW